MCQNDLSVFQLAHLQYIVDQVKQMICRYQDFFAVALDQTWIIWIFSLICSKPMIPLSGVRISWLMRDKKLVFDALAARASSAECRISYADFLVSSI